MELTAYLHPGWAPLIRPAPATRPWMDLTPESFAYRCLPLNIANAHGWEVLSPCGFEAVWDGGTHVEAVTVRLDRDADPQHGPVSLFGQGVLTFHVEAIFRTPPGWNLWIGGSPNRQKDAIAPLGAVVETDWSPYTFTMNWRFTRPDQPVRFEAMEPFCFLFPIERAALEAFTPAFAPLDSDPATAERFRAWSAARDEFQARMRLQPPKAPADGWQKHYYRGVDANGEALVADHRTKLRLKPFDRAAAPSVPLAPSDDAQAAPAAAPPPSPASSSQAQRIARLELALAKREWLLETLERQRALSPSENTIQRRQALGSEEFLERYYAPARPVILTGEMDGWPALLRWTPDYLKAKIGPAVVEYQDGPFALAGSEMVQDRQRRRAPFEIFIDQITADRAGGGAYLDASNSPQNQAALAPLAEGLGFVDKFLTRDAAAPNGVPWIGGAGAMTSLRHDLSNSFIAQVVGRQRVKMLPASEVGRLYNRDHVFSEIADLDSPDLSVARFPRLVGARLFDVLLEPGEILFMPLGWWRQLRSLEFSAAMTFTNFRWPNGGGAAYPPE